MLPETGTAFIKLQPKATSQRHIPDKNEPGGFVHSGGFLLIDKNRHVRGVYDGTNPKETTRLIADVKILLEETSTK